VSTDDAVKRCYEVQQCGHLPHAFVITAMSLMQLLLAGATAGE
jgi:hypothetical protein